MSNFILTPLEQFQIIPLLGIEFGNLNISFTNSALFAMISCEVILFVLLFAMFKPTIVPTKWQSSIELIYEFVFDMIRENIGTKGFKYFPFVFTMFTFILGCNLLGMIPYSFTVTSHLVITVGMSIAIFIGVTIIGLQQHSYHFFSFFIPPGVSTGMTLFLLPIEIISYFIRGLSLGIRLFANMMAGHSLLKIMVGFSWSMFSIGGILLYVGGFIPLLILLAIIGLEIGVAVIQAYVFSILICLYLSDAIHLH